MENKNLFGFFNKILGLNKVNEGYIGLTSFDKTCIVNAKEDKKSEIPAQTSFTGLLKRV